VTLLSRREALASGVDADEEFDDRVQLAPYLGRLDAIRIERRSLLRMPSAALLPVSEFKSEHIRRQHTSDP
jgi:hypothetical protein